MWKCGHCHHSKGEILHHFASLLALFHKIQHDIFHIFKSLWTLLNIQSKVRVDNGPAEKVQQVEQSYCIMVLLH